MTEPILLQTLKGKATARPPFWFMRQAGRVLPSYLKIKEDYTFLIFNKNLFFYFLSILYIVYYEIKHNN